MVSREAVTGLAPLGETIDRLTLLELRAGNLPMWGLVDQLYQRLRSKVGRPQSLLGAEKLMENVKQDDLVILISGFAVPPWIPVGETDGPLGAASLARAANIGLKARALVLTDDYQVEMIKATCSAAELRVAPPEHIRDLPQTTAVGAFPLTSIDESVKAARQILDELAPKAVISMERSGRNSKGIYHTAFGTDMSPWNAKIDYVITEARARGILTVGIGDLGNEAGLGTMKEEILEIMPIVGRCKCPCGGEVVTVVESDVTVIAICSNLGAYGITACLSGLLGRPEILQDAAVEMQMIQACVRHQGMEGVTAVPSLLDAVDTIPTDAYVGVVRLMRSAVDQSMRKIQLYRGEVEAAQVAKSQ